MSWFIAVHEHHRTKDCSFEDVRSAVVVDVAEIHTHSPNALTIFRIGHTADECRFCEGSVSVIVK